jgi:hypothetical protein
VNESEATETDESRGNREHHGKNRSPKHYREITDLTELLRRQFRQVAKSLTRRGNDLQRLQRRRGGDAAAGGMLHPPLILSPLETREPDYDDEYYEDGTLDCMNAWFEPANYFYYDDYYAPDQADDYVHF